MMSVRFSVTLYTILLPLLMPCTYEEHMYMYKCRYRCTCTYSTVYNADLQMYFVWQGFLLSLAAVTHHKQVSFVWHGHSYYGDAATHPERKDQEQKTVEADTSTLLQHEVVFQTSLPAPSSLWYGKSCLRCINCL